MSGIAGRSGRKKFVPTAEQRNAVKILVGLGVPQEHLRRVVINPQTGKPLSVKTLELAFALEIKIGTVQLTALIGSFLIDSVLGRKPAFGTPIKNDQARMTGAIFYLKCRAGWTERNADQRAQGKGGPLQYGTLPGG